jgi:hypothetical protein
MRTHPPGVRTRLTRLLVVIAPTLSLGAHWLALQSVAWVGMVVTYSQTAPLHEALSKTFDGRHPCSLCKLVSEGKAKEQKCDALKIATQLDMAVAVHELFLKAPAALPLVIALTESAPIWRDSPPTPPPRPA